MHGAQVYTTSHIVCGVTVALLNYGKYIKKVQGVHMQIYTIYVKWFNRKVLPCYLKNFKFCSLALHGALATKSRMGTVHTYTRQQTRLANTRTPPSQHNEE